MKKSTKRIIIGAVITFAISLIITIIAVPYANAMREAGNFFPGGEILIIPLCMLFYWMVVDAIKEYKKGTFKEEKHEYLDEKEDW